MCIATQFHLVNELLRNVQEAEKIANRTLAQFWWRTETPATLTCQFTPSPSVLASIVPNPTVPRCYVVRVPQGLGFRLLAWLRILVPYYVDRHDLTSRLLSLVPAS